MCMEQDAPVGGQGAMGPSLRRHCMAAPTVLPTLSPVRYQANYTLLFIQRAACRSFAVNHTARSGWAPAVQEQV